MPERPTIAFITTSLIFGGQERSFVDLAVGLNGERYRTIAITTKAPGPLARELRDAGVPVYSHLLRTRYDLRILPRLIRLLKAEHVDVVYTIGGGDKMFWGRLCGRLAGVPVLMSSIRRTRSADGSPSIERANRLLMRWTDCVLAVGEAQAHYLANEEGVPRARLRVIHNGVPEPRFPTAPDAAAVVAARRALGVPVRGPIIGIVAALRPEKAHEVFLEAARRTQTRHPTTHFVLIGDGPQRAGLEALSASLGLSGRVHFAGSQRDVPRLLPALDVICLSSHPRVETFPVSILEGMAAACAAVVTDVGSVRELVCHGETGLIVPPGNPAALADAFCRMIEHPAERKAFGRAGRARVLSRFTMRHTLRAHEALFDEFLPHPVANAAAGGSLS